MDNRDFGARCDLRDAADIAGGDHIGLELLDIPNLAFTQFGRKLRLQQIVGAGRATTQMTLRHIFHHEPNLGKQFFRCTRNFLSMLQRACGVIGDLKTRRRMRSELQLRQILADILGERRHPGGLICIVPVVSQHVAVVLQRGAAARGGDQDRVEPLPADLGAPRIDATPRRGQGLALPSHVVLEGATAAVLRHHDLHAVAVEEADGGGVDRGRDDRSDAAVEQRYPPAPRPLGRETAKPYRHCAGRRRLRGELQHGRDRSEPERLEQPGHRLEGARRAERPAQAPVVRQHLGDERAQQTVDQRAAIRCLDMGPGVVDQVHVMHP